MQKNRLVFQSTECLSQEDIQLYLSGELNESARYRVENHLLDCPLCSDAVDGFGNEYDFEIDEQLSDLKNTIEIKSKSVSKNVKTIFWTLNRVAAVILLLIISTATFFYWNAQKSENNYLAEFRASKDLSVRGAEEFPLDNQYANGLEFYRNENYTESFFFFENIIESQPENSIAHYYAGLSALNFGELDKAIENLTYARFNDEKYYEDATWNLVLANLSIGNEVEAKALIIDLLKIEGGFYNDKAEKLLKEIK